ncbi:MAG: DNA polymerase I, partial [Hyphomicrobiaceae bacterium]
QLARAGEIKQPKRREKLIEFAEQARIRRQLVTLKEAVPAPEQIDSFGVREPDPATLLSFMRAMEFSTLTKRVSEKLGVEAPDLPERSVGSTVPRKGDANGAASAAKPAPPAGGGTPAAGVTAARAASLTPAIDRAAYMAITDTADLERWIAEARSAGRVAIGLQTVRAEPMGTAIVGVALALAPGRAAYVPIGHGSGSADLFGGEASRLPGQIEVREALALLKPVLEDATILKIGHAIKSDIVLLRRHGIAVAPLDDIMLVSYALEGGKGSHSLDALSERHLGHAAMPLSQALDQAPGAKKSERTFAGVPIEAATSYAAEAADITIRLWHLLKPRLAAERVATVYETLERPLLPVIASMEHAGIQVDRAILSRLSSTFAQRIARLEEEVSILAGYSFNLGSPKQLGELLFDRLQLPGGKKTKSGQWETRAGLLDELAANEELPEGARTLINTMLEWRQLTKLKSTYTDSLPGHIDPATGRIHTSFALASTTTGRLASTDPNLQNIPIRTKEGREIRTAFIAPGGSKLISADYSQIELRVLAHIAEIPQLRQAFDDELDIHAMTASEMFGVPIKGMPPETRRRAKAINFGIIYGISAFGLSAQLGISKQEAADYINTYFQRFPGIRDYMDRTKRFAHDNGYVTTLFGRRVHYPEINTRNPSMRGFLERAAINAPIQGSAADIIRRAMARMPSALEAAGLSATRMLLQVHDELIFEAKDADVDKTIETVISVMEKAAEPAVRFRVPIHVDAKAATNWEAAH